jgi:hypothetical protein
MASPGGRIGKEVTEMNFKTLTASGAAATVAGLLAAPQAQADGTAWIYDSSGLADGNPGTYSHATADTTDPLINWVDFFGSEFDTSAISIETSGSNVTFTTYTNYAWNQYAGKVPLADWFFDTNQDGTFDFAFTPTGTPDGMGGYGLTGTLYGINGNTEVWDSERAMSNQSGGLNLGGTFSHSTAVCDGGNLTCAANARAPEVHVASGGVATSYNNITISDGNGGTLPSFPLGTGEYDHSYSFTLLGINGDGAWDSLRVFWGTGWCANDTIETVPIPAAAWLFGSAILGLGAVGWKRRSPAA